MTTLKVLGFLKYKIAMLRTDSGKSVVREILLAMYPIFTYIGLLTNTEGSGALRKPSLNLSLL